VAAGVALGVAFCLGMALLITLPANHLADGLVARRVYVDGNNVAHLTTAKTTRWVRSSFPDFGVTFSVPSPWFVYQRTHFNSLGAELGYVSTVPMLMGERVRLPGAGGVFMSWTTVVSFGEGISRAHGVVTTVADHPARVQHLTAAKGCRRIGGTREVRASIALTQNAKDPNFLFVQSCLSGPDRSLDQDVVRLLASIAFVAR
jgi:hypothetical protein